MSNWKKKNRFKKIVVSMVTAALMAPMLLGQSVKAEGLNEELDKTNIEQNIENKNGTPETNNTDNGNGAAETNNTENSDIAGGTPNEAGVPENTPGAEADIIEPQGEADNTEGASGRAAEPALGLEYMYICSPYIETPDTQNVVFSFAEGSQINSARLSYTNTDTGVSEEADAAKIEGNLALFSIEFKDETQKGVYTLDRIDVGMQEEIQQITLADQGIEGKFGVEKKCVTKPDEVIKEVEDNSEAEASVEVNVTALDENGEAEEAEIINEVIEETLEGNGAEASLAEEQEVIQKLERKSGKAGKPIVIVLDPGHDNTHLGAAANGYNEEKITLKIAKYCKEALSSYGVQVYLTRNGGECPSANGPVSGHTESQNAVCLKNRAEYAKNVGADIFVSFHLNSFTKPSANGAEVYYASSASNLPAQNQSEEMAKKIAAELGKLGLTLRNNQYGTNTSDFSVLRNSIAYNIPAVLIEHCFISNPTEADKYLGSDEKLKKLGYADAKGIIEHLSLVKGQWKEDAIGFRFELEDGTYPKDCWYFINGAWYHFDSKGYRQTGLLEIDGNKYYLDSEGRRVSDWQNIDNQWYFFDADGKMVTGWLKRGNNWYFLNTADSPDRPKGVMLTGWLTDGNYKYYLNPEKNQYGAEGIMRTGWLQEGNQWHFLNTEGNTYGPKGSMRTGWLQRGSNRYYLNSDGIMIVGWLDLAGKKYYFNKDGHMVTGEQVIDGKKYTFSSDGILISGSDGKVTGWQKKGTDLYFYNEDGSMATGWLKDGNNRYYLNPEKNQYGSKGAMRTGWLKDGDAWYFLNTAGDSYGPKGSVVTGWLQRGSNRYYLESDGKMVVGWKELADKKYYFDKEGHMVTGEQVIDGKKYTFSSDGTLVSDSDGKLTGWQKEGTDWYFYNEDGSMATGWLYRGSNTYYLNKTDNSNGAKGKMLTGWLKEGGKWYYFNTEKNSYGAEGVMRTGWLQRGSNWYFLNTERNSYGDKGIMRTGWLERGKNRYYLNPAQNEYGAEGIMAMGWREIDGTMYYFNTRGRGTDGLLVNTGLTAIMGKSTVKVEQMIKLFGDSGRTYPSDALKKGGAASIKDFCQIVIEEAEIEGVKAEVVFAQAMMETGYLQFGGDVLVSQFNFAGLGATGNGVRGEAFKDVRTGIRAQVQHLKAYASSEPLKQQCVDNRFLYVKRNVAPYVEWLGQKENPQIGYGWATGMSYGFNLKNLYIVPMYSL